jgi:hypothetical protein
MHFEFLAFHQVIEYDAGTVEWLEQFKLHLKEMPPFADFVYAQCRAKFGLPSVVDRRCFELIVALADHRFDTFSSSLPLILYV